MKARCMISLPPGDQKEFVSAVPLLDTVSKSIQAFVQELGFGVSGLGIIPRRTKTCAYAVVPLENQRT